MSVTGIVTILLLKSGREIRLNHREMISRRWLLPCAFLPLLSTGAGAAGLYSFLAEYDEGMPPKWTTGLDQVYQDSAVNSLLEIVGNTDPGGAAAYLERISSDSERGAALAAAVQRWATEQTDASIEWLANSTDRPCEDLPTRDSDPRDDRRGRGGYQGAEGQSTEFSQPPAISPVIPEPSTAVLAGVGAFALLRRRRSA